MAKRPSISDVRARLGALRPAEGPPQHVSPAGPTDQQVDAMQESMAILADPEMAGRVRAGRRAVATGDAVELGEASAGSPPSGGGWRVVLTGPVARKLEEWGEPAATEVRQVLATLASRPAEAGQALGMGLAGVWSARGDGYRVLYAIHEAERLVTVLTVDDRG